MTPIVIGNATLYNADCIEVLKALPENSIEACLTDPPYGLSQHSEADIRACMAAWLAGKPYVHGGAGFMGFSWDSFVPGPEMWKELYRVLKPGAHLLVFAGTRTADLMTPKDREDRWPHEASGCKGIDCDKKENCVRYQLCQHYPDNQALQNWASLNACQWMRKVSPCKNPYPYFIAVDVEKEWRLKHEPT